MTFGHKRHGGHVIRAATFVFHVSFAITAEVVSIVRCGPNAKRATLVGETTRGGAHPGGVERLHKHFSVFVPGGRAINPISKTNWEGTGVIPDVAVAAEHALITAERLALQELLAASRDAAQRERLRKHIEELGS